MTNDLTITIERIDDIPVLLTMMEELGLSELFDQHFRPHGNWEGLVPGRVLCGWLSYILSMGDHRLNQVEEWGRDMQHTLKSLLGTNLTPRDFTDDRLAIGLDLLSQDQAWAEFEGSLNRRTLRVYKLAAGPVRLDTTSAMSYGTVTEDGLFQFGHSKDHRPDLPQVKVMLATLDPMGMPLVTQVVSGEKADDPLYIPAIDQVRKGVGQDGLLYVGDCKIMALATRAHLVAGRDFYLAPFSTTHIPQDVLDSYLAPVWQGEIALTDLYRTQEEEVVKIAEGFERTEDLTADVHGQQLTWTERRLVVRSLQHAEAAINSLQERLGQAGADILALNESTRGRKALTTQAEMREAAEAILKKRRVVGLLNITVTETTHKRSVRKYRDRPAGIRTTTTVSVSVQPNEEAIQTATRRLGWRVYGTNQSAEVLSIQQAILAYRNEYIIERNFGRLKGRSLSLTPMYLADDGRATGLIRLLSVGLRILTLLEGVVRQRLSEIGERLAGLYAGNPKRTTARPSAELLLRAFKGIALSFVTVAGQSYRHVTPLTDLQHKILCLIRYPTTIYENLATNSWNPP